MSRGGTRIATTARVLIPGLPQNWSQWRGTSRARDAAKAPWRDLARLLAHSARNDAHWPLPVATEPPAPRWLLVDVYKHKRPLFDEDGCVSMLKPLIDGLQGALIFRDSVEWCHLAAIPEQRLVPEPEHQCVVIVVHLVDPRRPSPRVES